MKRIKFFENFQSPNFYQRNEKEILAEDNLESLLAQLNFIRKYNDLPQYEIGNLMLLIQGWALEKFGFTLSVPNFGQTQMPKEELLEEIKMKLQEVLRFCSSGKWMDGVIRKSIEELHSMI